MSFKKFYYLNEATEEEMLNPFWFFKDENWPYVREKLLKHATSDIDKGDIDAYDYVQRYFNIRDPKDIKSFKILSEPKIDGEGEERGVYAEIEINGFPHDISLPVDDDGNSYNDPYSSKKYDYVGIDGMNYVLNNWKTNPKAFHEIRRSFPAYAYNPTKYPSNFLISMIKRVIELEKPYETLKDKTKEVFGDVIFDL